MLLHCRRLIWNTANLGEGSGRVESAPVKRFAQKAWETHGKYFDEHEYLMWDIVECLLRRWLWWRSLRWLLLLLLLLVLLQGWIDLRLKLNTAEPRVYVLQLFIYCNIQTTSINSLHNIKTLRSLASKCCTAGMGIVGFLNGCFRASIPTLLPHEHSGVLCNIYTNSPVAVLRRQPRLPAVGEPQSAGKSGNWQQTVCWGMLQPRLTAGSTWRGKHLKETAAEHLRL